jgi:signal transduction histidine kinase
MDLRSLSSGAQSWLGVPLLVQGRVIGVLGLYHAARAGFSERDAGMAVALANAVAAAIDNVRAHEQAQRQATLSERQRLSRELHDSVLQGLYGISLGASSALKLLEASPADAVRPLQYIQALAQSGLAETRAIIHDLRPTTERVEGVIAALTRQAVALGANYELRVDSAPCDDASLPPEIRAALYGILREALHNVNKHARATEVDVRLACQDGHVSLLVQDNGDGFDLDGAFPGHLGLRSMRERAETLGGSLSVESTPGSGTRIHAILPLAHGA